MTVIVIMMIIGVFVDVMIVVGNLPHYYCYHLSIIIVIRGITLEIIFLQ